MRIEFAFFSNVGPRETNQDRILLPYAIEGRQLVAAIADGIGGAPGGAEAASIAVRIAAEFAGSTEPVASVFSRIVAELQREASSQPEFDRMGTTLSLASIASGAVTVGHVGDTRIYHLRGRGLNSLTNDQTEIAELVRNGVLSARQAKRHPRRNVLISALSPTGEYEVQESHALLEAGDRILLLTDGVHQRVTRGAILKASIEFNDIQSFIDELERLTVARFPSDNFSALAIQVVG
jgi:protein phosphatase